MFYYEIFGIGIKNYYKFWDLLRDCYEQNRLPNEEFSYLKIHDYKFYVKDKAERARILNEPPAGPKENIILLTVEKKLSAYSLRPLVNAGFRVERYE